ncbi:MAG: hypothetical protein Q4E80_06935 [Slackia faecicanis]|uniref:cyanophycin synthetase family protein n=1 Tax=Slackia faecicanis TaxID=255723 RepID=UPI001B86EC72|nr:hypothetical protein [Slackia faecicanis]MDO5359093.1 hypothetical protein [Slackia faecicanis]
MERRSDMPQGGIERAISIEHMTVRPDRVIADVRVGDERFAYTTPTLIAEALGRFPHLLRHTCINDKGPTFSAVANSTALPHLLEHMVIEEQVRLDGRESASYVGKTSWTDRRRLRARVEVSYADDLVALQAFKTAQEWLDDALCDARRSSAAQLRRYAADAET